jgi:hypothetical protein
MAASIPKECAMIIDRIDPLCITGADKVFTRARHSIQHTAGGRTAGMINNHDASGQPLDTVIDDMFFTR